MGYKINDFSIAYVTTRRNLSIEKLTEVMRCVFMTKFESEHRDMSILSAFSPNFWSFGNLRQLTESNK